jgi:hypothetical protein
VSARSPVPIEAAQLARELRQKRRRRSGLKNNAAVGRWRPWPEIADEVARQGLGRFAPADLAEAVAGMPLEGHELAPRSAGELEQLEAGWRAGWDEEFPGEPWPGRFEAQRRIRAKHGL